MKRSFFEDLKVYFNSNYCEYLQNIGTFSSSLSEIRSSVESEQGSPESILSPLFIFPKSTWSHLRKCSGQVVKRRLKFKPEYEDHLYFKTEGQLTTYSIPMYRAPGFFPQP